MIFAPLLVGLVALVWAGGWQARQLHPAHEARLRSVGMASGLLLIQAGLILSASPLLLRTVGRADLAAACEAMLGGPVPGGVATGLGAAAAAAVLIWRFFAGAIRVALWQRRCRADAWLGAVTRHWTYDMVVLPTGRLGAYTVGGRRPQIVVTRGVVEGLPPEYADVITAHEKAHVDNRHHRFIMFAAALSAALGWLPPVRVGADRLRLALERWADEDAARIVGRGREGVRETLLEVVSTLVDAPAGAAGFGGAGTVESRLRALAEEPAPTSALRVASGYGAAGLVAALTVGIAVWSTHGIVAVVIELGHCCHG